MEAGSAKGGKQKEQRLKTAAFFYRKQKPKVKSGMANGALNRSMKGDLKLCNL